MAKIYTKTGDLGKTSLIGGTKVPKNHLRIETYGTIDELNSYMGLTNDHVSSVHIKTVIKEIQDRLFTVGSSLACDPEKEPKFAIPDLHESDIQLLEKAIDTMDAELPAMKSFVLPAGHPAVSTAHVARCVCRRAERCVVRLQDESGTIDPLVLQYLNRLSDYLFQLARFIGHRLSIPEIPWKPRI